MVEKKNLLKDPANFFLIASLILGIIYCVAIPYGAGFDEERHMTRIYYMSQGHLLPNFPGQVMHRDIADLSYQRRPVQVPAFDMFRRELFLRRFSTFDQYLYEHRTQSIYSPVIFLPQALLGRYLWWKFDFPILPAILLQKFAGLLIYIAGAYMMIRLSPFGKWTLTALALMPSALYQAATVNADGFTTAVSFALIGYTLYVYINESSGITSRSAWLLFFLSILLGASKPGAIIVLPLLLILYPHCLPYKKRGGLLVTGTILAIAVNIGWWAIAVKNSPFSEGGENVISSNLMNGLTDPSYLLLPLLKSIVITFPDLVKGWIAIYGYGAGIIPWPVYFLSLIFLLGAYLIEPRTIPLNKGVRLFLFFMFVLGCFAIYSMVFVTVYNGTSLAGLTKHGRYNIPFVPLFFLSICGIFTLQTNLQIWAGRVAFASFLLAHVYFSLGIYNTYYTYCGFVFNNGNTCTLPIYKNLEKESDMVLGINDGEKVQQSFLKQCGKLESVEVYIQSTPESGTGDLRFTLLDKGGNMLVSQNFAARDILDNDYLTLPVKFASDYTNENFVIELEAVGTQFPEKFRFPITPQDYYPGELTVAGSPGWGDLIIHYTCSTP